MEEEIISSKQQILSAAGADCTKTEKDQIWRYVTTKVDYSALKYEIVRKVYETKHF